MPVYSIETPSGRKLKIEAPDEETALRGAKEWHEGQNKPKGLPGPTLSGMVGHVVDLAKKTAQTFGGAAAGIPQSLDDEIMASQLPAALTATPVAGTGKAIAQAAGVGKPMSQVAQQDLRYLQEGLQRPPTPGSVRGVVESAAERPRQGYMETAQEGGFPLAGTPSRSTDLLKQAGLSESVDDIIRYASSSAGDQVKALGRARHSFVPQEWADIQRDAILKLGQTPEGIFDPRLYAQNYGALTPSGKRVLFGSTKDGKALMRHLDTIHEAATEVAKGYEVTQPTFAPSLNQGAAVAGREGGRMVGKALGLGPLSILTAALGEHIASKTLNGGPAAVASTAAWSKAYSQLIRNPSPRTLSNFDIMTRNLSNTLGEPIDRDKLLKAANIKLGEEI